MIFFRILLFSIFMVSMNQNGGASAENFQQRVDQNQLRSIKASGALRVVFFGTSSFLLDDGKTQILIDGFFTRKRLGLLGKFSPSETQILQALEDHGICNSKGRFRNLRSVKSCHSRTNKLKIIIPTHGHYDHAMDAPYIAAHTGATLVGDQTVQAILDASIHFDGFENPHLIWDGFDMIAPFASETQTSRKLGRFGNFKVTLFRTAHNINLSSPILNKPKTPQFRFPSTIWKMKQGTTFSVLIEHFNKRMLFVPSAGIINDNFKSVGVRADVVFLGIGGLGFKSKRKRFNYWKNVVSAVRAKRVIPIHWDDDQVSEKPSNEKNFRIAKFRKFSVTMKTLDKLAQNCAIDIVFAPPALPFDPFQNLDAQSTKSSNKENC